MGRTVVRQALAELDGEGLLSRKGPRLRTVTFDRGDESPAWLKRSVAILSPGRLAGGAAASGSRWLQYTTLGTINHLRDRDIHALTLSLGAIDAAELERLARSRPLGMLIPEIGKDDQEIISLASVFQAAGVPVVCYGGSPALAGFDRVISDHARGSLDLARAVVARGCKSVVRFWPQPWSSYWLDARSASYTKALDEAGLEVKPIVEFPRTAAPTEARDNFEYSVKQVAGFLLEPLRTLKPDALLVATDRDLAYASAALRLYGIEPGRDILLAGYDNYWHHCEEQEFESAMPAFTVDKCNQQAGSKMVQLLFDRINGQLPTEPQTRVVPQELITLSRAAAFAEGA